MKRLLISITLFAIIFTNVKAEFLKNSSFAIGLSTNTILGSNPGGKPIVPSTDADPIVIGGGFYGSQPGLEMRYTIPIDEDNNWRIPIGIDYQFFMAKERLPEGKYIEDKITHTMNLITPYVGVSYVLQNLKYLKAKTYISLEMRATMLRNIEYRLQRDYFYINALDTTINFKTKPEVTRIGGIFKLGVEGYLFEPLQLNASVGLSMMNLIGRDNKRYELLTPLTYLETKESFVYSLNISILFQYSF
jgi:hypothetical protein